MFSVTLLVCVRALVGYVASKKDAANKRVHGIVAALLPVTRALCAQGGGVILRLTLATLMLSVNVQAQNLEVFYGQWCAISAEKYRGGLTSESEAKARIGTKLTLTAQIYIEPDNTINSPVLKYVKEKIEHIEGVVPEKNSIFYGIYPNRSYIEAVQIYESEDENSLWNQLELIEKDTVIELYDGYVFVFKKCT